MKILLITNFFIKQLQDVKNACIKLEMVGE